MSTLTRRTALGVLAAGTAAARGFAASDPFPQQMQEAMNSLRREGRYLPLHALATTSQDPNFRSSREQWFAFVGDERSALASAGVSRAPAPDLTGAHVRDAIAAIVEAARGRRVVMLNEAHTASRHRGFLAAVARALRPEGFTHLAAETFLNDGALAEALPTLRARDPVPMALGYYTADPVFAEAVREALELGYQLVAYEQRPDQETSSRDPKQRIPVREQAQADNLAAALRRWPEGRFLVYVGHSHLDERQDHPMGPWFAARLPSTAGVDPLTVQQASSGSFGPHADDHAVARSVLARFKPKSPIVVSPSPAPQSWPGDIAVFHPSLLDVEGRPGWLAADPSRKRAAVRLPRPALGPSLAQATPIGEPEPAIPADQYLLQPGAKTAVFFLRPGRYRVRLETPGGFVPLREIVVRRG